MERRLSGLRGIGMRAVQDAGVRLYRLRDRLLTDAGFQRWASRFPLTRGVARRQAAATFDLCAGFVYSQALLAIVRLGVLQQVASAPIDEGAMLRGIPLPPERARLLVDAALALDLLSRRPRGMIGVGWRGAAIVANPGIMAMIEHHAMVYRDLADPVALLAGAAGETRLGAFWPYVTSDPQGIREGDQAAEYTALMATSQAMLCDDILDAYPFGRHRSIMDVGGGDGRFLSALAGRYGGPRLELFDLPAVANRAVARVRDAGLEHRIRVTGGDFFSDPLPKGHDAVTLVRVAHDHDDRRIVMLFRRIREVLAPGGVLVVAEPMSGLRESARAADVYFAFYLLAMGSGRPRSPAILEGMLRLAGFSAVRQRVTARPMLVSVIVASIEK